MKYTVVWKLTAERRLTDVWIEATNRNAVTSAVHQIDQTLQHASDDVGESRDRGRRILLEPPLGVLFKVHPKKRSVYVLSGWSY